MRSSVMSGMSCMKWPQSVVFKALWGTGTLVLWWTRTVAAFQTGAHRSAPVGREYNYQQCGKMVRSSWLALHCCDVVKWWLSCFTRAFNKLIDKLSSFQVNSQVRIAPVTQPFATGNQKATEETDVHTCVQLMHAKNSYLLAYGLHYQKISSPTVPAHVMCSKVCDCSRAAVKWSSKRLSQSNRFATKAAICEQSLCN